MQYLLSEPVIIENLKWIYSRYIYKKHHTVCNGYINYAKYNYQYNYRYIVTSNAIIFSNIHF